MKLLVLFIVFFNISYLFAGDIKIEVQPQKPAVGEVFQINFRIFTDSDETPEISFTPGNLEVTGKSNQGVSTRTIYANGKLTVSRELNVSYDVVANKVGTVFLRDIKINLGGKILTHPTFPITIFKEAEQAPEVFVMADVPKRELYVGEGIVVRYYLLSKVPVSSIDIKKYPKLNHFLKRFLQEPERSERVSYNGDVYLRTQIYAAKLFPESVGEFTIDPISLTATYPVSRMGDPFGAFGLSRNLRTKSISSESVKIIALPLPTPVPEGFTGLVGKHDIQIQFGNTKLIINEPLTVKLTVTGVGALENLEAPLIFQNQAFEEFESNGDLRITNSDEATKTFDYTFLARENVKRESEAKELFYFDPDSKSFKGVKLEVPEIEVAGGGLNQPVRKEQEIQDAKKINTPKKINDDEKKRNLLSPQILTELPFVNYWLNKLNYILLFLFLSISLVFVGKDQFRKIKFSKDTIPREFKKGDFSISLFLKWLSPVILKNGKTPLVIISESDLSEDSRKYFLSLLMEKQEVDYSKSKSDFKFTYVSKHFKNLDQYIQKAKNENNS